MSATRGGAALDPLRHLPTPSWAIDAVLPELSLAGTIVDAGCGGGAILSRVHVMAPTESRIIGVELQPHLCGTARDKAQDLMKRGASIEIFETDFLTWEPKGLLPGYAPLVPLRVDLVIGNPPFSRGEEFYRRARDLTRPHAGTVCLLLRLDWLGPRERRELIENDPPDALILERRPQFRLGADGRKGTDSCEYAWMTWGPGRGGRWKRLRCAPADRRRKLPGAVPAVLASGELPMTEET